MGPAPKKSLALQAGWMALPDVATVSGRSGADAAASLADPVAPAVAPTPLMVTKRAASSMAGAVPLARGPVSLVGVAMIASSQEQPDAAMVTFEVPAQSMPPAAQETVPDMGQVEEEAAGGSPTPTSKA